MARQVHVKPLEAFQPDGAFKPADLSSCCRDEQLSNLERGLGYSAGGWTRFTEKSDRNSGFETRWVYWHFQCRGELVCFMFCGGGGGGALVYTLTYGWEYVGYGILPLRTSKLNGLYGNVLQMSKPLSSFKMWKLRWRENVLGNRFITAEFRGSFWAWQGEKINPRQSPCGPLSLRDLSLFPLLVFQVHFFFPLPTMSISCLKLHLESKWAGERSSEGKEKKKEWFA